MNRTISKDELIKMNQPKITVNRADQLPSIKYEVVETVADMTTKTSNFTATGNSLDECFQVIVMLDNLSKGKLDEEEEEVVSVSTLEEDKE